MPVTLEDSVLDRLAQNPAVVAVVPLLQPLANAVRNNPSNCACKGKPSVSLVRNALKQALATGSGGDTVAKIKQVLNTDQLTVFYSVGNTVQSATI